MTLRYLSKFTSADGSSYEYVFPLARFEYESSQGVKSPRASSIGNDYAVRLLGTAKVVRDVGMERIRCVDNDTEANLNTEADNARSKLYLGAYGKLWTTDGTDLRWAWAELAEMPQIEVTYQRRFVRSMVFGFVRFSDWFDDTAISATAAKSASPATLDVTNPGNIAAKRVQIRIQSSSSAGFSNIKIVNGANDHEFESTRDAASTNDELRLDTTVPEITYSTDDGVNRTDDYSTYVTPPASQKLLAFDLEPGVNTLTITCSGTPDYTITVTGDAPYA